MLLPTPSSDMTGETVEEWDARWAMLREQRGYSSSDQLPIAIQRLTSSAAGSLASPSQPLVVGKPRTITAGSGPSSPVSFASLDPDGSWLRTCPDSSVQASLLGPLLERFSGTWPRSGSMHGGIVYAHPTLERPTAESGSSYLLGTVEAHPRTHAPRQSSEQRFYLANQIDSMLHTPTATDGSPRYDHRASPGYTRAIPVPNLDAQIAELLPTPKTPTGGSEKRAGRKARGSGGEDLEARLSSLGDPTNQRSEDGSE